MLPDRLVIVPNFEQLPLSLQDKRYLERFTTLINADMAKLDADFNCELWGHYEALQLMISRIDAAKPIKIWIEREPGVGPFGFIYGGPRLVPYFRQRQPIPQPIFKYWTNSIKEVAEQIASTLPNRPGIVMIQPTLYEIRLFQFQPRDNLQCHRVIVIGGCNGPRVYEFAVQ